MASGDVSGLAEGRRVIANSFDTIHYEPKDVSDWDEPFERFVKILNK